MRILAAIVVASLFPLTAFADDGSWHVMPSVSAGIEDLRYAEVSPMVDANGNQPVLDRNTGVTPTVRIEVEATSPRSHLFARGSASWTGGSTRYDGGVQDVMTGAITPQTGPTSGYMTDFDLVVGGRGHVGRYMMVGGFAGIGHHTWDRDLRGVDSTPTGYLEQYGWTYLQVGVRIDASPLDRLRLSLEGSVLLPKIGGLSISHQENGLDDESLELGLGLGTRVRLVAAYAITPTIVVSAIAGLETDNIANSTSAPLSINGQQITDTMGNPLSATEPFSNTTRTTLTVGVGYAF